ncbi:MAG: BlaI/MecI/CopY family transcriptional regulator [Hymenobacteraceae bacterium]|nr:BlaI/MecI/CopY family transcriptional regulator [Hymenobacteraceae bacterium]MDX5397987.1 BlaI/MecI/CopY family transcriptional regulator [Hymenobacteraceae bacterium]MDX5444125.1 BlaI/MecI/CopY family transcriptional regulator [Hymenobacteraceae bacterium]MDX5514059.1 BlaI/MecI/CopY family transcriptional regulator [Hymenobacteraceae bacterium]
MAANKPTLKPTDAELEILQILWQHGPATVRFINDELNKTKETGYTTTLKIMQIMYEKGMLDREEAGRSHIYRALLSEENTQKQLLNKFLDTTFRGSAMKLVMQALGNHKTTADELNEIRNLLNKLEGGKK